jgi:hypothetical protein
MADVMEQHAGPKIPIRDEEEVEQQADDKCRSCTRELQTSEEKEREVCYACCPRDLHQYLPQFLR